MIKKSKEQQIEQIIQYILNNKYKRVTQQEIADALGYSNSTFGHLFSQYFEMTYTRFMRKLRMRNVAKEMYGTYEKLDMIGERNGFKSKKFFVEFKRIWHYAKGISENNLHHPGYADEKNDA